MRQASATPSGASTPMPAGYNFDSVPHSPSIARASIGVDGAMGLSESEAEGDDSGGDSGSSSPVMGLSRRQRQGLKGSKFNFTPMERKPSLRKQHQDRRSKTASVSSDDDTDGQLMTGSWIGIDPGQLSAAAAAADLERDVAAPVA